MAHEQALLHCVELLAPLGAVRTRRMFGGHGIYLDDLFIALVAFDRLYLKTDAQTEPRFAEAGCEPFTYEGSGRRVTLAYWTAPADALESPPAMAPWARLAVQAALTARAAADLRRSKSAARRKPAPAKPARPARPPPSGRPPG